MIKKRSEYIRKNRNALIMEGIGEIHLPLGSVDIADPCDFDPDLTITGLVPGEYHCVLFRDVHPYENTVWKIELIHVGDSQYVAERRNNYRAWRKVGSVGVDSGAAGFFDRKAMEHKTKLWETDRPGAFDVFQPSVGNHVRLPRVTVYPAGLPVVLDGFWSYTAYGDGRYPVYACRKNGKIVALEIRYFQEVED